MNVEIAVRDYIQSIPEIRNLTHGHIYTKYAPINTGGKTDTFVVVDRYESIPLDRTFSDTVTWLRVKVEVTIYGKNYDNTVKVTELIQKAMEQKWEGSSDGELGLEPIEISNTVWMPFRLDYQIYEYQGD